MNQLDDDIRTLLADEDALYDLEREEGVFRQMAGIFRGKMRWMAITAMVESIVFTGLAIWAGIGFFRADDVKTQIGCAAAVLVLCMLLLLIKLWGWMLMNRYAIQREIKRLELIFLEHHRSE